MAAGEVWCRRSGDGAIFAGCSRRRLTIATSYHVPSHGLEATYVHAERANLYQLTLSPRPPKLYRLKRDDRGRVRDEIRLDPVPDADIIEPDVDNLRRGLRRAILSAIEGAKIPIVWDCLPPLVVDDRAGHELFDRVEVYSAYKIRVMRFGHDYFLCLDHIARAKSRLSLATLMSKVEGFRLHPRQRLHVRKASKGPTKWVTGQYLDVGPAGCELVLDTGERSLVPAKDVVPVLTRDQLLQIAPAFGGRVQELERRLTDLSLLTVREAPQARLDACTDFAEYLKRVAFPFVAGETTIQLNAEPVRLRPPTFFLGTDLVEPTIALDRVDQGKRERDITRGLVNFGVYEKPNSAIRLVLITTDDRAQAMDSLVQVLNRGSRQYPGALRTFRSEFVVQETLVCPSPECYDERILDFVQTRAREETDVALVYLPSIGDLSDPDHPYHRTKGLLLREGLPSQMVDESTVLKPDWRDLTLALNIYAKAGYAPWVLDEPIDGVDLFIGLSSSWITRGGQTSRVMGYVNVFDSYGRWRFYRGDTKAFPFDDRLRHFRDLVAASVASYRAENGGTITSVQIHLTKRFSARERQVLAEAVRRHAPDAAVTFVWVNPHHILRLYDLSDDSDGSVERGTYLWDGRRENGAMRAYLATTGTNVFGQRGVGTPVPLELTVWSDPVDALGSIQHVLQHVLSLTRLNWASTRNFCQEPITTKFARDIARHMNVLMTDPNFFVNPSLRKVPWFL